jgi:hypothetical protein
MPFLGSGITTGLLGYTLRKEFLGDALPYREVEVYDYEFYSTQLTGSTPYTDIENNIKSYYASNSGNINIKVLETPADYTFPNDHLRVGRILVQVEVRKVLSGLLNDLPELSGNYYKGLDSVFLNTYSPLFNDFKEEFSFENADNGNDIFSHSLSFTLQSGGKNKAIEIATGVFSRDKDTTFGISAMVNGVSVADTGIYLNFYTESYDLIRNTFSFSKKREILSSTGNIYSYNLNHSIDFKPDGLFDVTEKGEILGRSSFDEALRGYSALSSSAFGRCSSLYNIYKNTLAGGTVSESLVSTPLVSSRNLLKPNLSITYELGFTNNPNIDSSMVSIDKTIEVDKVDGKYININHIYNFLYFSNPSYQGIDSILVPKLQDASALSPTEISNFYTASPFYNSAWPTMNLIKRAMNSPTRKKSASVTFSYTNNPIYFVVIESVSFSTLEYRLSETHPIDMVTEYKIINRPNKLSIVNYGYQTDRGEKTISISAKLTRPTANAFSSLVSITGFLPTLYAEAIRRVMDSFVGINALAFTYYLSNVKYKMNSDNEIGIDLTITYTMKKYTA